MDSYNSYNLSRELRLPPEFRQFLLTLPSPRLVLFRASYSGHAVTLFCSCIYVATCIRYPIASTIFYRIGILAAIVSYSAFLVGHHVLSNHTMAPSAAITSETFHLVMLAFLWLFTPAQFFKLFPFALYAMINLANFTLTRGLNPQSSLVQALAPLVVFAQYPLMRIASHVELLVFPIVFIQSLIRGTLWPVVIFFGIWCLRVEFSVASRSTIYSVLNLITLAINQPTTPPDVVYNWQVFRSWLSRILPLPTQDFVFFHRPPPVAVMPETRRHRRRKVVERSHPMAPEIGFDTDEVSSIFWKRPVF